MKTTSEFIAVFDAQGIEYRTETDGSLITDCPVCELENKGKNKAKIFPDGGFTCQRFAGTVATAHKQEMLSAWNLESAVKPSAFMSETILGGQVTFEIERGERGWQRVTARNCDSVLHLDTFNLADSSSRVKFIKNLSLSENDSLTASRTLINLADRYCRVLDDAIEYDEREPEEVKVLFKELADGRRAEITRQGFAVYNPITKATTYSHEVEDEDGTVYVPLFDDVTREHILLPSGVEEYNSEAELFNDVKSFLHSQVDIPERELNIASKYVFLT